MSLTSEETPKIDKVVFNDATLIILFDKILFYFEGF